MKKQTGMGISALISPIDRFLNLPECIDSVSVDRSWLRDERPIYDEEAIANPLGARTQCFGTQGR